MSTVLHLRRTIIAGLLALGSMSGWALEEILMFSSDLAPRLCDEHYFGRDGSYKILVPDLAKKVIVKDQDISPGITTHVTMGAPDTGFLFMVSTRIRDDLPKDSSVLNRVESRMQPYPDRYPGAYFAYRGTGPYGRTFEYVLLNATSMNNPMANGNDPAPYPIAVGYRASKVPGAVERVGVHRYFVAEGYMYEFAVLLHTGGPLANKTKDDLVAKGNEWLDLAIKNFTPGRFTGCRG